MSLAKQQDVSWARKKSQLQHSEHLKALAANNFRQTYQLQYICWATSCHFLDSSWNMRMHRTSSSCYTVVLRGRGQVWNLLRKNQTWQWSNCKLSSKCSKVKRPNETHSQLHSLEACRCSTEEKRRPMHLARWWKWSVQLGRGPNACGPSSFKLLLLIGGLLAVTCATVSISHTVIAKLWAYKSMTLSFQESEKLQ